MNHRVIRLSPLAALPVVVAVVLTLSACSAGEQSSPQASASTPPSASGQTSASVSSPTLPSTVSDPAPPATTSQTRTATTTKTVPIPNRAVITVTGQVEQGVEQGCLLLGNTAPADYLLLGGERAKLVVGTWVRVTGTVERTMASMCQQGIPLRVTSVEVITKPGVTIPLPSVRPQTFNPPAPQR